MFILSIFKSSPLNVKMVKRLVRSLHQTFVLKPKTRRINREFRRAVKRGDLTEARRLHDLHGEIIDIDKHSLLRQRTLMHHAAATGNVEMGKFLRERGANEELGSFMGYTPYGLAKKKGRGRFVHELYSEGR